MNGYIVNFLTSIFRPTTHSDSDLVFVVHEKDLLIKQNGAEARIPRYNEIHELVGGQQLHYLGRLGPRHCFAGDGETINVSEEFLFRSIRELYGTLSEPLFWTATKALHLVAWDSDSRFCGRCGAPMALKPDEEAKICDGCSNIVYPRISPAIIAAIIRDDTLLLLNHRRSPPDHYTLMAGFVDPGETLEQAVAREAFEEAGITVKDIRYFGSQPWAFTGAQMTGFTATFAGGDIKVQDSEIRRGGWYRADNLPTVGVYLNKFAECSITWQLMKWFERNYG